MAMGRDQLDAGAREALGEVSSVWWLWLVLGVAWILASLTILELDTTSVTTVGIIIGILFLVAGLQEFMVAAIAVGWRWLWVLFGGLFVIAGIWSLMHGIMDIFKAFQIRRLGRLVAG